MLAWRQTESRATSAARTGRWSTRIYRARRNATETEPRQRQCEPQNGVASRLFVKTLSMMQSPKERRRYQTQNSQNQRKKAWNRASIGPQIPRSHDGV